MQKLAQLIQQSQAKTKPVNLAVVQATEKQFPFAFSQEYRDYLCAFGSISYEYHETYGLGVKENHFLHIYKVYQDLSRDTTYPANAVPLMEIGDGHYYLYDNATQKVLLWASPNGGIVKTLPEGLEDFLAKKIFSA
ncbi:SMI1/KNR4 family protein [Azotobacter beijerinckii]|uniref:SMI1/KNR4 family protein n=1 Tax=Azotobacter beijerinckii TaxID=170623 RepID=UPI002955A4EF|nr:SMI1/KNR4 family protein [Azotobacter beijerinckii]MDV7212335.1 SMI1/KNR4 family protein [Azotobacter beijerinckii]